MNIKEFLLARIEEDEAMAWAAIEDDGGSDKGFSGQYERMVQPPSGIGFAQGGFGGPAARMIVTFAVPARVLAECAAKRAVAELHDYEWMGPDDAAGKGCEHDYEEWPCPTLRTLATVYSDHPDYQKEWAVRA